VERRPYSEEMDRRNVRYARRLLLVAGVVALVIAAFRATVVVDLLDVLAALAGTALLVLFAGSRQRVRPALWAGAATFGVVGAAGWVAILAYGAEDSDRHWFLSWFYFASLATYVAVLVSLLTGARSAGRLDSALVADGSPSPRRASLEIRRPYCLRCFATIAGERARCEACGHVSRGDDRTRYWTVKPGLLLLSRVLQTAVLVAYPSLWLTWLLLGGGLRSAGAPRAEVVLPALGLATLLGPPLYWTFGQIVRRKPELNLMAFWAVLFAVTSAALCRVHVSVAAGFATVALLIWLGGRAARRWKRRLVETGPDAVGSD